MWDRDAKGGRTEGLDHWVFFQCGLSSKSSIAVVEDNGEESVGENGEKDDERQDQSL